MGLTHNTLHTLNMVCIIFDSDITFHVITQAKASEHASQEGNTEGMQACCVNYGQIFIYHNNFRSEMLNKCVSVCRSNMLNKCVALCIFIDILVCTVPVWNWSLVCKLVCNGHFSMTRRSPAQEASDY